MREAGQHVAPGYSCKSGRASLLNFRCRQSQALDSGARIQGIEKKLHIRREIVHGADQNGLAERHVTHHSSRIIRKHHHNCIILGGEGSLKCVEVIGGGNIFRAK